MSLLAGLHRALTAAHDDVEEPPPHVSKLASLFSNGLMAIGVPGAAVLHYQGGWQSNRYGQLFVASVIAHAAILLLNRFWFERPNLIGWPWLEFSCGRVHAIWIVLQIAVLQTDLTSASRGRLQAPYCGA